MATSQGLPEERPRRSILDKTRLCKFYLNTSCSRGTACRYAHGLNELQPVPDLTSTKLCPLMKKCGVCTRSECSFAHSKQHLSKPVFSRANEKLGKVLAQPRIRTNSVIDIHSLLDTSCAASAHQQPIQTLMYAAAYEVENGVLETTDHVGYVERTFTKNRTGSIDIDNEPWHVEPVMTAQTPSDETDAGSKYDLQSYPALLKVVQQSETAFEKETMMATGPNFDAALFLKTKICKFHEQGECKKGLQCGFAHSEAELRPLLDYPDKRDSFNASTSKEDDNADQPNRVETDLVCTWDISTLHNMKIQSDKADLFLKTKMCKFHLAGSCTRGASCRFAHDQNSKRVWPAISLML